MGAAVLMQSTKNNCQAARSSSEEEFALKDELTSHGLEVCKEIISLEVGSGKDKVDKISLIP
jgi:hypothetical protein